MPTPRKSNPRPPDITKTCLYNSDPPLPPAPPPPNKPHFYIVKLWCIGVNIIFFLFLLKNIDCRYSLEPPCRGGSNEYPQSMFWAEIWKYQSFLSEDCRFLEVNFSIYLNRRVFVMSPVGRNPTQPLGQATPYHTCLKNWWWCFGVLHLSAYSKFFCLWWGFTAQSTHWGHVEHSQFS